MPLEEYAEPAPNPKAGRLRCRHLDSGFRLRRPRNDA